MADHVRTRRDHGHLTARDARVEVDGPTTSDGDVRGDAVGRPAVAASARQAGAMAVVVVVMLTGTTVALVGGAVLPPVLVALLGVAAMAAVATTFDPVQPGSGEG